MSDRWLARSQNKLGTVGLTMHILTLDYTRKKQILIHNLDLHRTRIQPREGGFRPGWVLEVFSSQMRGNHSNDRPYTSRNISRTNAEIKEGYLNQSIFHGIRSRLPRSQLCILQSV